MVRRGPKPATLHEARRRGVVIGRAIVLLQQARELLKDAEARRTVARVRLALSSAKGAQRNAASYEPRLWAREHVARVRAQKRSDDAR